MRILEGIKEYERFVENTQGLGVFGIYDMVRATLQVREVQNMKEVYCILDALPDIQVVKIVNKLGSEMQHFILNVIYDETIIAEIIIQFGPDPIDLKAKQFLRKLTNAMDIVSFREILLN